MANENVAPKRQPVKAAEETAVTGSQSPARPTVKFIEETIGYRLTAGGFLGGLLDLYNEGYFDDENGPPLSVLEIQARAEGYQKSAALDAARLKREQIKKAKEQFAASQTVVTTIGSSTIISAQTNPADITCTGCNKQFEFLKTALHKLCPDCQLVYLEAECARARDAEAAIRMKATDEEKEKTLDELREICRESRTKYEKARKHFVNRSARLLALIKKDEDLHDRLYGNEKAKAKREQVGKRIEARRELKQRYWDQVHSTEDEYERMKAIICERRGIHPAYRYCRNNGLPIPWGENRWYCDDACKAEVAKHGDVSVDMGPECVVCGARLKGTQAQLDALPWLDGGVYHTYECLMSDPDLDEDNLKAYGPEADCWKPVLHAAGVRPAWSYTERRKLILSSPEKVLAMTGGPTAKALLAETRAALAAPEASMLALSEFSATGPEHRLIEFVASLPAGTVVLPSHARGKKIADNGLLPALFEAVADRGIFTRVGKGYKLADKTDMTDKVVE